MIAVVASVCTVGFSGLLAINFFVLLDTSGERYAGSPDQVPHAQAAIVLGALVQPDGTPSTMLEDRLQAAAALYKAGRVDKVLVSGDHGTVDYDEVGVMARRMLALGVKPQDVFTDHAGFDTWSTMVRAKKVFDVSSAIVVTQNFHLPRAVYLAEHAGLHAEGYSADRRGYGKKGTEAGVREWFARVKSVGEVAVDRSPRFLGPQHPITGDGRGSWGNL